MLYGGKNTQKNCTKKYLNGPDNHNGVITHLESDILECEVKWALGSITTNKVKRQPSEWEKIIAKETTDKEFISKIYKQLI